MGGRPVYSVLCIDRITSCGAPCVCKQLNVAFRRTAALLAATVVFGLGTGVMLGRKSMLEFFASYLVEQSLGVDNLIVVRNHCVAVRFLLAPESNYLLVFVCGGGYIHTMQHKIWWRLYSLTVNYALSLFSSLSYYSITSRCPGSCNRGYAAPLT